MSSRSRPEGRIDISRASTSKPTEDHRFGLRNYALTYSGLFLIENSIEHDVKALGKKKRKRR